MSFSLSEGVASRLSDRAKRVAAGNASVLVDLALKQLLDLPDEQLAFLLGRRQMDRMGSTRDGWMRAFWIILGEEMGRQDMIDNPYAPRNYGDYYVVLLLNHPGRYDDEDDPFVPYAGPRLVSEGNASPFQWHFKRSHSPVQAAEDVARKLRQLGATESA